VLNRKNIDNLHATSHIQRRYLQAENRTYEENFDNNINADFNQFNWTKPR